jgi:transcription termination/antitermination protein NusA
MLFDLKVLHATLEQLEDEKKIPRAALLDALEQALAAAYKKDYGKKGQVVRCQFDSETGDMSFEQVKTVVDETLVRPELPEGEEMLENEVDSEDPNDERPRFDPEKHILIDDARRMKSDVTLGEELIFPLEIKEDFGRIAAQTAKQVIIQRIREAEKGAVMNEYADRQGDIVSGIVQKVDRGMIFVDFQRATGVLPKNEQLPGEHYKTGDRIRAYLYLVEETPRGVYLRLSRSHPRFIEKLFALESPEIATGTVVIEAIAREAGSRSKIAVFSTDENIDPIGACVGQKGIRVATVISELHGEKIDIIPWSPDNHEFIARSLAPAKVIDIELKEAEHVAKISVADDQLSLAIGKGGQNVRLAAKLTGWKIDIQGIAGEEVLENGDPVDAVQFAETVEKMEEFEANAPQDFEEIVETTLSDESHKE